MMDLGIRAVDTLEPTWKHGEARLQVSRRSRVKIEWAAAWRTIGARLAIAPPGALGDDDVTAHLGLPGFSIWVGVRGVPGWDRIATLLGLHRDTGKTWPDGTPHWRYRKIDVVNVYVQPSDDWYCHLAVWQDENEWAESDWCWGGFLTDIVFGRATYSETPIETRDVTVPMPEASYPATATLKRATWSRPRWIDQHVRRVELEIPTGVPVPGKGENSHDCGDSAIYSLTTPARTIEDGIGAVVVAALKKRQRYGWSEQEPRRG